MNSENIDWKLREEIRKKSLARRAALSSGEREEKSKRIAEKLFSLTEFLQAKTFHIYLSINSEADTSDIISKGIFLGKRIAIPKIYNEEMIAVDYEAVKSFSQSGFGTSEPQEGKIIPPEEIDLVLVPLTAVDNKGNRLGYGKGFYDKFLLKTANAKKIGIAFSVQVVDEIVSREDDIKLNGVVTEGEFFCF